MPPSFFDKHSFLGRVNGTWMDATHWGGWMEAFLVRAANLPTANTTTLIRALVPEDQRLASHLLHASVAAGRVPRTDAFSTVVAASRKAGDLDGARAALAALHECGLRANPTDCHALLAALCEAGRTDAAEGLYREMARAGTEVGHKTRAVLLTGLLNSGEGERALAFAHELLGGPYRDLASSPPDVPLGLCRTGQRHEKERFLREEWAPFHSELEDALVSTRTRHLLGVAIEDVLPSQSEWRAWASRCAELTTVWHGAPNLSAVYELLVACTEA